MQDIHMKPKGMLERQAEGSLWRDSAFWLTAGLELGPKDK